MHRVRRELVPSSIHRAMGHRDAAELLASRAEPARA